MWQRVKKSWVSTPLVKESHFWLIVFFRSLPKSSWQGEERNIDWPLSQDICLHGQHPLHHDRQTPYWSTCQASSYPNQNSFTWGSISLPWKRVNPLFSGWKPPNNNQWRNVSWRSGTLTTTNAVIYLVCPISLIVMWKICQNNITIQLVCVRGLGNHLWNDVASQTHTDKCMHRQTACC